MWKTEIATFIILASIVLLIFITGILLFVIQYRRRRMLHENEKTMLNEMHHRELLSVQLQIQTQTMQDIGREIHDNVGQKLTLASIYANQIKDAGRSEQVNRQISAIGEMLNESLTELRGLSKSLVSADAEASELAAILRRECGRVRALNICTLDCNIAEDGYSMPATVKNFIVRIAQEALQNSLKHSGCTHMELSLEYLDAALVLRVTDDGRGFDTAAGATGIGLENMRQRARLINGVLRIRSDEAGTTIELSVAADSQQPTF